MELLNTTEIGVKCWHIELSASPIFTNGTGLTFTIALIQVHSNEDLIYCVVTAQLVSFILTYDEKMVYLFIAHSSLQIHLCERVPHRVQPTSNGKCLRC